MGLERYRARRDFEKTPEPPGRTARSAEGRIYVVQAHAARRLHYDLRLEHEGVLWSWAVPKGPSLDPEVKRLAMATEDHPVAYAGFEGVIPKGEYGGGAVLVWDEGLWVPLRDPEEGRRKGHLEVGLLGRKLHGVWHLVRTGGPAGEDGQEAWLLMKARDADAAAGAAPTERLPHSVRTGRVLEDVARDADRVWDRSGERPAPRRRSRREAAARLPGARRAALRRRLPLPEARAADRVPPGDGWIHEVDRGGRRLLLWVREGEVRALWPDGSEAGEAVLGVRCAVRALGLKEAWLDGELVVPGREGRGDARALEADLAARRSGRVVFFAQDLAWEDGVDLRDVPLERRKARLAQLLDTGRSGPLAAARHLVGDGAGILAAACRLGARGVLSRPRTSPYRGGRSASWRHTPCPRRPHRR